MPTIVFRGKAYNSVFEMPSDIKEAYQQQISNMDDKLLSSKPLSDLPKTEDMLPSDKSIYEPSQPIINPENPTIEPESGLRRLVLSLVAVFLLIAIGYLAMQFML